MTKQRVYRFRKEEGSIKLFNLMYTKMLSLPLLGAWPRLLAPLKEKHELFKAESNMYMKAINFARIM